MKTSPGSIFLSLLFSFCLCQGSSASVVTGNHRFGLSGALVHINNPDQTSFSLSAEYEYRMNALLGVGGQVDHVFSTPSLTRIAAPTLYLHPLLGDFYVSASPVLYLGSGNTKLGARFTSRLPLSIGILSIVPVVGVDVIKGGPNYLLGLGIGI